MQLPPRIDAWLSNARAFQLFQLLRQGGLIVIAIALAHSGLALAEIGHYEMLTYLGYLLTFFWVTGFMQGLLSQRKIGLENATPALILEHLLLQKWKLEPEDNDMIIMQHEFDY